MTDVKKLTKMALLLALLCISAFISFPNPLTPGMMTTLLTLIMCLVGFMLKPRDAFIVLAGYVILASLVPVYVGGRVANIFGPTGGYILSWPIAYTILSALKGKATFLNYSWRSIVITVPLVHIGGIVGYMIFAGMGINQLWAAFLLVSAPFIPTDIVKCIIAAWLATKIKI